MIKDKVVQAIQSEQECENINPFYMPALADKLLKHVQLLPLWSNVCRDEFGYGRIPASFSSCESEFNKIKNVLLKHEKSFLRVDAFMERHIQYLQGKMKFTYNVIVNKEQPPISESAEIETASSAKEEEKNAQLVQMATFQARPIFAYFATNPCTL